MEGVIPFGNARVAKFSSHELIAGVTRDVDRKADVGPHGLLPKNWSRWYESL